MLFKTIISISTTCKPRLNLKRHNLGNFRRAFSIAKGPMSVQAKVNVDNVSINYDSTGNGPHPVLCMPGALGFIESDFEPILPKFNKSKFTVITWDPPGYGKSRPPERDFTLGSKFFYRDAEYANNLMKTLGFPKYSILGWSDGANTAMVMGFQYPENIRKIVMWGGNAFILPKDMEIYKSVEDIDKWSAAMKAPMIKMYGEDYFRKTWKAWVRLFQDVYEKEGGDFCKKEVSRITAPTLIVHGMKDYMVPLEHAQYLNDNIKGSKLHVMKEGKHNLHLRYADEFVNLVEQFLED